jgi:hypothetical protein
MQKSDNIKNENVSAATKARAAAEKPSPHAIERGTWTCQRQITKKSTLVGYRVDKERVER